MAHLQGGPFYFNLTARSIAMTQPETISNHLHNIGSITPLEAQSNYNVWRLAAVINVLKNRGLNITKQMKQAPSGAKYAEYSLG